MSIKKSRKHKNPLSRLHEGPRKSDKAIVPTSSRARIESGSGAAVPITAKPEEVISSYLVKETATMARQQRLEEQEGHRQLAKVHARSHSEQDSNTPEGELQNSLQQHPWLAQQRFDGIDPNLNPEPPLNTEARREYDNKQREQEMEKQLRLGNMPKFSSAPKPQGP